MTPQDRKALAEQILGNPLFKTILSEIEANAIEQLIFSQQENSLAAQMRVQAIRSFREDLEASLDTHERKGAVA